jgi:hypothetical protein
MMSALLDWKPSRRGWHEISTHDVPAISPITRPRPRAFQAGTSWRLFVADEEFKPIQMRNTSSQACEVAGMLSDVPTLSELTARLGALPRAALEAAVAAEPAIYQAMIAETTETADYLRHLADTFTEMATRLRGMS